MDLISNYRPEKLIGESAQSRVYVGYYAPVPTRKLVIKVLKSAIVPESTKRYFQQKIEHLKILRNENLIVPLSYQEILGTKFMTREYDPGMTLREWIGENQQVSLKDFFVIASQLADLLDNMHQAGIVHGGIKPNNILIDSNTLKVKIVDFITPFDVRNISHFIYNQDFVRNTLSYTSPEQTGRINHRVEFTTDIYSLGIIFYEMLTGRLPFDSLDPLAMIHSHLAEESEAITALNPSVPTIVRLIVEKMLLKQPEKRYQRGFGLLSDLNRAKALWEDRDFRTHFQLGLDDRSHRVTFISKMVGRDQEAEAILREYSQVTQGAFKSVFISGLSGIGKTRLIQELQKPIVKSQGYFTSGKFDVYQKNVPYSSLIQAFRNLIRTYLTESDQRVLQWKEKIQSAVGGNGALVVDIIPELGVLLGPQPTVPNLSPVESRNRFNLVFGNFLSCLASKNNPLVLFIDDLQWSDLASFDFLTNIVLNAEEYPFLFLMGAFRHNEVDESHPLVKMMSLAKQNNCPIQEIRLGPISEKYTHEMVSYILDEPLSQTLELGVFLHNLTEGNPLFVSESLSYLYNENLMFFDSQVKQWKWSIEKIRGSNMPSTVVGLFSAKVKKLPYRAIELLEFCSCLGNLFRPSELSVIKEVALTDLYETLKPALSQGLLIENKDQLQFVHDKVQEATLLRISSDRRRQIHWQIGYHLYQEVPEGANFEKIENIFKITSHLNLAYTLDKSINELFISEHRQLLSKLNYYAGNAALNSLATDAANEYFKTSMELLTENSWKDAYEYTYRVYQKTAKTELMVGRYENSEKLLNEILSNAKSDLDKAEALAEQTTSLSSIGNFIKAIEAANQGLAFFDKAIPADSAVAKEKCQLLLEEIHAHCSDVWSKIIEMPFTEDRKNKIELAFYSELIPDLYMSGLVDQLYLSAAQSTIHCLSGGMDESVIYSFSIMGLNLGEQENFEFAFRYEDLAKNLCEKYPNTFGATRGMNGVVWCNMHSRSHPKEIVAYCLRAIQCGKNCGDLYNAGLAYGPLLWNMQVKGTNLSEIEDYVKECFDFSKKFQLSFSVGLAEAMRAGWVEPMKRGYKFVSIDEKIQRWESVNHIASIASYYFHQALTSYYFGNYQDAQIGIEKVRLYLRGLTDNVLKRQWYVLQVLNEIRMFDLADGQTTRESIIEKVRPILEKVKKWAEFGPLLRPYLALAIAEMRRLEEGFAAATNDYFSALNEANSLGYAFLEAYIYEILAKLFNESNRSLTKNFATISLTLYHNCHAERKVFAVSEEYGDLISPNDLNLGPLGAIKPSVESTGTVAIDDFIFIRASQGISAKMDKDALLQRAVETLTECFGAQYGVMALVENNELSQLSESFGKSDSAMGLASPRRQKYFRDLDMNIQRLLRFVQRTKEEVLINNENQSKLCAEFDFLSVKKSVLCLPIIKKDVLMAIVYLENRLSNAVFTQREVDMIKLLCAQTAISLENANLYEEVQRENRHRQKIEKELVFARDEAEFANSAKGQFLANMSHEIRTPLHSIIGVTELLLLSELSEEQRKILKIAHAAGESLLCIINDVLDISRIDAGAVVLERIAFSLSEQIQICLAIIATGAGEKNIEISSLIDPSVRDQRYGDPTRLRQVILNLMSNAVKFSSAGAVSVKVDNLSTDETDAMLIFAVSDEGIGISEDRYESIFEIFRQVDASVTRKFGGSGLGLSISKKLVALMHGNIWVESRLAQGSTFFFTAALPPTDFQVKGLSQRMIDDRTLAHNILEDKETSYCGVKPLRILLADDSEDIRILFTTLLHGYGHEIVTVQTGQEALDAFKMNEFDLVFMDVQMPVMDGYSATKLIRKWEREHRERSAAIIAFTAHAFKSDFWESTAAGCDDHMSKPFKRDALLAVVDKYSRQRHVPNERSEEGSPGKSP
jgi:predicted ATPase/signal transduction histidine kinase/CheY-like chemotaxis protein